MHKASLVLLSLLSFSLGFTLKYSGNVSLSNIDEFKFRSTNLISIPGVVYNGVFFTSIGVDAGKSGVGADILFSALSTSFFTPPSSYVSYFSTNVNANINVTGDPDSLDFSVSKAFIASTFIKFDEVDVTGKVVNTVKLSGLFEEVEKFVDKAGISFLTLEKKFGDLDFNITSVFSATVGVLDVVGQPVITPKSLETLLSFSGYEYANEANSLVLSVGVGSASLNADGNAQFSAGVDTDGVYLNLATVAQVDGKEANVKVSALTNAGAGDFGNSALAAQVALKYGGRASFKLVQVTFPAGAKSITYDPSIGAGANAPDSSAAQMGFLAVLILALLF